MNKTQLKTLIEREVKKALNERGPAHVNAMIVAQRALESGDLQECKSALLRLMQAMAKLKPDTASYLPKKPELTTFSTSLGDIQVGPEDLQ